MSDVSISERRLSAALDRIGQLLDRGGAGNVLPGGTDETPLRAELDVAHRRIAELTARLQDGPAPASSHTTARDDAPRETAQLIAANDDLAAANAALIAALDGEGDAVAAATRALQAEVDALRAARAAEAAQLADLLAEVEAMLSAPDTENDARHHVQGENI